jgi:DNA-directed RNA polymerase
MEMGASRLSERSRRTPFQPIRNLATAAERSAYMSGDMHGPIEGMDHGMPGSHDYTHQWIPPSTSPLFADRTIIIADEELLQTTPTKFIPRIQGIGGDVSEMMANLDVSLRLAKFDRAATLVERLSRFHPPGTPQFMEINNRYLRAMVLHMIATGRSELILPLQTWFEVKLPRSSAEPNGTTLAIMLLMALRMLHGSRRGRTVRRYWDMVKQNGFEEDVLHDETLLSPSDLNDLASVSTIAVFDGLVLKSPELTISPLQICPTELQSPESEAADVDFEISQRLAPASANLFETVRPTPQKGEGLKSLHETLSLFTEPVDFVPPRDGGVSDPIQRKAYQQLRQEKLESNALQSAINRWRGEVEKFKSFSSASTTKFNHLLKQWHTDLVSKIEQEKQLVDVAEKPGAPWSIENRRRRELGVYLRAVEAEKLAAITILSVINIFVRGGIEKGLKVASIVTNVGREIQDEVFAEEVLRTSTDHNSRMKMVSKMLENRKTKNGRSSWQQLVARAKSSNPQVQWPTHVHAKVGGLMMTLLFETAKAPVPQIDPKTNEQVILLLPAFQHSYEVSRGRKVGLINMHHSITARLTREPSPAVYARHMPMLAEPRPWTDFTSGGYYAYRTKIMRTTPGDLLQKAYVKEALADGGLESIRTGLDVLGRTAWVVNEDVFKVMLEAWNSGKAIAKMPPLDPRLPTPRPPAEDDVEGKKEYDRAMRALENKISGLHSSRCFINLQMEIARAYLGESFYLPHNMDFRGRAYPLPSFLNQMGADNARSLLLFEQGKPLGATGLKWLKIHLANVFGYDKASLQEREAFAMEHLDDIVDSANHGLRGRRWFLEAEDPWQCLAACCELRNAFQLADPTEYSSRLPVHQDGSCNGLQHYAALGGDTQGAQQVNLEPGDRPSDVYTGVAEFVKEKVARDAAEGHEIAKVLDGKIKRKIVKQTVMTNVYGVTFIGAMRQVRKQLQEHYPELQPVLSQCSAYVARSIFDALGSIFSGAHSIQYWLGDSANRISLSISPAQIDELAKRALGSETEDGSKPVTAADLDPIQMFRNTVIWTTPLGLPVAQPYRSYKTRRVYTSLQSLSLQEPGADGVVSKRKQLQAFPPNFIHSLDATHMMLSAIECDRRGLAFSAVHDSFWTHACDVDTMNVVLRDCFVRMHSDDIIKRLASEFRVRYGDNLFLGRIATQSRIGKAILKHRREQRKSKFVELLEEYQRQTLLRSEDPELQEKGRAMVTSGSIFDAMGGSHNDLTVSATLGETAIGVVQNETAPDPSGGLDLRDPAVAGLFSECDPGSEEFTVDELSSDDATDDAPASEVTTKPVRRTAPSTWLWLPLTFRGVPAKGDFDVRRLRESQYFFS